MATNRTPKAETLLEQQAWEDRLKNEEAAHEAAGGKEIENPRNGKKRWYRHKDVNCGQKSFAAGLNFYKIVWVFFVGCVFGVLFESVYVWLANGGDFHWSVGLLYGPFNQVYGLGAVLFTVALYRFRKKNAIYIFLASFAMGLAFEYACSWAQQIIWGSTSWNYSEMPFNIGGRTNLFYGVGWGVLGLLFITHAWPFLSEYIERIPNTIGKALTAFIAAFLALDMAISGIAVYRWSQRDTGVAPTNAVERWLDSTYPDERMQKKYPNMEFVNSSDEDKESTG